MFSDVVVGVVLGVDVVVGVLDVGVAVGVLDVGVAVGVLDVGVAVGVLDVDVAVGVFGVVFVSDSIILNGTLKISKPLKIIFSKSLKVTLS